ncbi:52 kDa repressor of the inhibitor of the protein kinase-like [Brachionichthys hirsutus]|uniref:52 kDa repressor of the inhibitor of the protein kinase-like n=1 Tax=Brachionichthys hirsutus TaxID=412623 RepID=UPI003604926A
MQNRCAVPNCSGTKFDPRPLFRFPRDPERSKKWVEKCQRDDLQEKPPDQLFRFYRVCGRHFEATSFQGDIESSVLKEDAVPTLVDGQSQPQTEKTENETEERKKIKKSQAETAKDDIQAPAEEDEYKEYLKSLFEVVGLLGEQSIPPTGPGDDAQDGVGSSNFQALLEYRMSCGDEGLKKRHGVNHEFCSSSRLNQMIEVFEKHVHRKLQEEVQRNGFFSLLTEDLVKISGGWFLPVFVRFMDQSNCQKARFLGFVSFEGEADDLAERALSEMTDDWGLDMDQCRGQAHSCSGTHFSKCKTFSSRVVERYPLAVLTLNPASALNASLASGMAVPAVQLVVSILKKIDSFFGRSPLLLLELEHAISIFFADREEKATELKAICQSSWTGRNDAFEVAAEILEALLLCVDSVHDNEDMRWSDEVTHGALVISRALANFEFIMALVVLKNVLTLTQAFGKNVQGDVTDAHFAASSLNAVRQSLQEVSDNIDVYHEFWTDEAVNLASAMEIPVKVPRAFLRKHRSESGSVRPESYYKDHVSVPVVNHVVTEVKDLFSESHLKALRCLSLVPAVIEHQKSAKPEEDGVQLFKGDLPNAASLSAELHCWWVKWSKKVKGAVSPSSLQETLQLADVKFFPNVLAVLRLVGVLPTLAPEDGCNAAFKRFQMCMENTPDGFKSKSLAFLNINYDVGYDLDALVEEYAKAYPDSDAIVANVHTGDAQTE